MALHSGGLHHLHVRKRLYKHLSPYPAPTLWKRWFDYTMYGVAVLSPITFIPQIIQLYTVQDASGLSLVTWVFANVINVLWLLYGILHKELPLIFAGSVWSLLNAAMLYGILIYS